MPHLAEILIPGIIASGIENIRIDPIGGRFSTRPAYLESTAGRQLTHKAVAQADLPSHTSKKDVIYAIGNEVVINGDMVAQDFCP